MRERRCSMDYAVTTWANLLSRQSRSLSTFNHGEDVAGVHRGPLGDPDLRDLAGAMRGDLVLHLHRFDHADEIALGDLLPLLYRDLEDRALERRGELGAACATTAAAGALALRRGGLRRG